MKYVYAFSLVFLLAGSRMAEGQKSTTVSRPQSMEADFNPELKPFYHGVASGDPTNAAVILWTRVTPGSPAEQGTINVLWKVATDVNMQHVVKSGTAQTDSSKDYVVKLDVSGLQAFTYYYYQFTALGKQSIIGRTKTAPRADQTVDRLRFGVVSCSNYPQGYFVGYGMLADKNDMDGILHLGDYIYEYEEGGYGYNEALDRPLTPEHEILSLSDYRLRYSVNRLDPDLMRLHQLYPFVTVWDDHETADNSYKDGANNHTEGTEGAWVDRKAAGVEAYNEWMPIRTNPNDEAIIRREFSYGTLMNLFMVDTRLEGRDKQSAAFAATAGPGPEYLDSSRSIVGQAQYEWLTQNLKNSRAIWNVLGNQVMFSPLRAANSVPINMDQWDGYPGDQTRLMNFLRSEAIPNVVVLTGDIHSSWGIDIAQNPLLATQYNPVLGTGALGVEFVCPGITSPPFGSSFDQTGTGAELEALMQVIKVNDPHIKYIDLQHNGYLILDITDQKVQSDWFTVDVNNKAHTEQFAAAWYSNKGENHLQSSDSPTPAKTDVPVAPSAPVTSVRSKETVATIVGVYPNPTKTAFTLQYALQSKENVKLTVVDLLGKKELEQVQGVQNPGIYELNVVVEQLPIGVHLIELQAGNSVRSIRFVKQ